MAYKHIFWDFNGTLADDVKAALAAVNDMLERKGRRPITLGQYYEYVETPIIGFYRHILPPEELDFNEISRNFHKDYLNHPEDAVLAEGALPLLERLRKSGAAQYIITANYLEEALELIKSFGIEKYFDRICGASDTLAGSKVQMALELFNELDINPSEAIFIGDTLHDLEVANAMGIDCILVSYGHQGKRLLEAKNVFNVESLGKVEEFLFDERCVDLHAHSSRSDGSLSPAELIRHAKEKGISAIALTDHDSVDGIKEARAEAEKCGIEFVSGIEFSAADIAETHIIGLFINEESEELLKTVNSLKTHRRNRMEEVCRRLRSMGLSIDLQECEKFSGKEFIGRAHIAGVMVEKGYCSSISECFEKYIGFGKPAYAEKNELSAVQAIKAIRSAGGLAFLAHLNQIKLGNDALEKLIVELKAAGLNGIEGYYTEYSPENIRSFRALAQKYDLFFSGGSDFHGALKPHIEAGSGTGGLRIPYHVLENIKRIHKKTL